jgi:hypothetical protein
MSVLEKGHQDLPLVPSVECGCEIISPYVVAVPCMRHMFLVAVYILLAQALMHTAVYRHAHLHASHYVRLPWVNSLQYEVAQN